MYHLIIIRLILSGWFDWLKKLRWILHQPKNLIVTSYTYVSLQSQKLEIILRFLRVRTVVLSLRMQQKLNVIFFFRLSSVQRLIHFIIDYYIQRLQVNKDGYIYMYFDAMVWNPALMKSTITFTMFTVKKIIIKIGRSIA